MGWKTLKERFSISNHIVWADDKGVHIGSGFVSSLVLICATTGAIRQNEAFARFVEEYYPRLAAATPAERLDAIRAQDEFGELVTVFTYDNAAIIEKQCEVPNWPNVTVDGALIDEAFSTDKLAIVLKAKRSAKFRESAIQKHLLRLEADVEKARQDLLQRRADREQLDAAYPEVVLPQNH